MRAYIIHRAGSGELALVRTQDEARPHGPAEAVDIPTSPRDTIAFINDLLERERSERAARMPRDPADRYADLAFGPVVDSAVPAKPAAAKPMDAGSILARMDIGGDTVDRIVEVIGASHGYSLRRYACAVAVAFTNMADRS